MYYKDQNWSVYLDYSRPNIKLDTVKAICNDQNQCRGFSADFCVWISPGAPSNETTTTVLTLLIFSGLASGGGAKDLAKVQIPFTWRIP